MNLSDLGGLNSLMSLTEGYYTWLIVAVVLAILGSILTYFLFCKPEKKYGSKFVTWLRDFLNFEAHVIEPLVKITYMFLTVFFLVMSFSYIQYSFILFLYELIVPLIGLRMGYELIMLFINIHHNVKELNKKGK